MKRHFKVIFEAVLSVLIIIDILFLALMTVGFIVGIKATTVYDVGNYDLAIVILILIDLIFIRLKNADKIDWQFIRGNWAYIVSIVPLTFISFNIFNFFNYITIIGLIGIIRIYALANVVQNTSKAVSKYPSKTKLDYATVLALLVLIIGSFFFFLLEHGVNPEVPNYESAVWYTIVSMTTVGYGDVVPTNLSGRIMGVILILSGMAYFSLVTATLAYSFIDIFRRDTHESLKDIRKRTSEYDEKLDEIKSQLNEINKKLDKKEK